MTLTEDRRKEIPIPCGSPSCLASAVEKAILKQTETQNENITNIISIHMKGLNDAIVRIENGLKESIVRLERKHDTELDEVFKRMSNVEILSKITEIKQVGLPRCEKEMTKADGRMDLLESCVFTTEQKSKMLEGALTKEERDEVIKNLSEAKQTQAFMQGVKIGIVILIIMAILKFGLDIYYHAKASDNTKQQTIEQITGDKK